MSESPHIRLQMRSSPLYLSGARELVGAVARRLCFSDEACGQISLAVDEALCNIIRHGYERRPDGPIWISITPIGDVERAATEAASADRAGGRHDDCACGGQAGGTEGAGHTCGGPEAIKIVIEDEARQVDPEAIRSRDLEHVRPGGLGVHIIRSVMDEVIYERRDEGSGRGMRLTMIKRRQAGPAGPGGGARAMASAGNSDGAAGTKAGGGGGGGRGTGGG